VTWRAVSIIPYLQAHRTHGLKVLQLGESISIDLGAKEWEVYTVVPIIQEGDVAWTPVALDQMFNGGGAVRAAGLVAGPSSRSLFSLT